MNSAFWNAQKHFITQISCIARNQGNKGLNITRIANSTSIQLNIKCFNVSQNQWFVGLCSDCHINILTRRAGLLQFSSWYWIAEGELTRLESYCISTAVNLWLYNWDSYIFMPYLIGLICKKLSYSYIYISSSISWVL